MAKLVEFKVGDNEGDVLLVEVEDVETKGLTPVSNAPGKFAAEAKKTFEQSLANLEPMVKAIKQKLSGFTEPADEVEVKFSVKLSGEVGAVLTKVGGEANYEITLRWQND